MKKRFLISLLIALSALFHTVAYAEVLSPSRAAMEQGEAYGEQFGTEDGLRDGRADYKEGLPSGNKRHLKGDKELVVLYELSKESLQFKLSFLRQYKLAYVVAYDTGYREAHFEPKEDDAKGGVLDGEAAGRIVGEAYAISDFIQGRKNDWTSAYARYKKEGSVEARFFLNRDSDAYRIYFIGGFEEAFRAVYTASYRSANLKHETMNINSKTVDMAAQKVEYADFKTHVISGTVTEELFVPLALEFEAASLYEPTVFSVHKLQESFNMGNYTRIEPVSSAYIIGVGNSKGAVELLKPVTLTFNYYGSEYAGIYLWKDNQWVYQYSKLEDGKISTEIPMGYYNGGTYAIFIDESAKSIAYNRFHWGQEALYTLARRGYLTTSQTLQPSKSMTRIEFAKLLYQMIERPRFIKDEAELEQKAMAYVLDRRLMSKKANNQFARYDVLTYGMFEQALSAILTRSFKWSEASEKMLREEYVRTDYRQQTTAMPSDEVYYALVQWLR
ncbi:hypothetical protein ACR6HW_05960 [Fusibacter sp. JL298sf-3]